MNFLGNPAPPGLQLPPGLEPMSTEEEQALRRAQRDEARARVQPYGPLGQLKREQIPGRALDFLAQIFPKKTLHFYR